jgi:hypothetical protein
VNCLTGLAPVPYARRVSRRQVLLACTLLAQTACVSFNAVRSTGALAEQLTLHSESLAYVETLCASIVAVSPVSPGNGSGTAAAPTPPAERELSLGPDLRSEACASLQKDAASWALTIEALGGYGSALRSLADSDAVDLQVELERLRIGLAGAGIQSLETERARAALTAANQLLALVVQELRRGQLARTVRAAEPHVQRLARELSGHIGEQRIVIQGVHVSLVNAARDLVTPAIAEDAVTCPGTGGAFVSCNARELQLSLASSMLAFAGWLQERSRALGRLQTSVQAFSAAHAVLARNADQLGSEDAAQQVAIVKAINAIYTGARSAALEAGR